ncbi:hypothetical protein AB0D66_18680 [Streptomyces sp. NPDC048270]|uniref:hypothetical protein n=1 Tax=Streptomyces sp. NPDC048270 TaxID=3154615 RepID=UPI0033DEBC39
MDAEPDTGGSGGRDALRDAVAAWVATADEPPADAGDGPVSRPADSAPAAAAGRAPAEPAPDADSASARPRPTAAEPARDADSASVRPRPTAAEPAPAPRTPATDSAAAQPGPADEEDAAASRSAAPPSERSASVGDQRTTAFRAVTPPAPGTGSASVAGPAGDDAGAGVASAGARPARDQQTTAFRAVTPADAPVADSASASAEPTGADRAAASRANGAPGSGSGSVAGPTGDTADAGAASAGARPVRDQQTTAFRAVTPADAPAADSASAPAEPTGEERAAGSGAGSASVPEVPARGEGAGASRANGAPGSGSGSVTRPAGDDAGAGAASAGGRPVGDQQTTAFRAVKPATPAGEAADSERTAVFRAVRPGASDAPTAPAAGSASASASASADESGDSERTAVFRAVKPAAGEDASVKEPAPRERTGVFRIPAADADDSERTATFRAVKPPAPADRPADSASAASPAAAPPKASTFVPLRTDEPGEQPKQQQPKQQQPEQQAPKAPAPAPAAPAASTPASMDRSERTTQQPLPPKPPLDMLADLTNNPPPPPSPLRTAVRRFKIYFPLVVLLAIILAVVQLVRPLPEPALVMTAKSSYTFGGAKPELPWPSEGQAYMAAAGLGTLGQSGEQKPVPIASVTKSMTAYIILRDHPIKKGEQGAMIDVDKTAETEGKKNDSVNNESTLDTVKEGDKISEYDAIAALMIPSANNIARLLARWDSGSQEAFVKKMNDTAKELGMANTTYTDPSGLDATTVSTAEDQVKLGLKLVEIETLLDITKKPSWVDPSGKKWDNWNRLVPYNDSLGIKTGTTTKAGGNLLFAAQKKIGNTNQLIVGAVLGQHKPPIIDSVISASKQLMVATQKALEGAPVVKKGQVVGYVDDGLGGRTPVVATADVQAIGWASLTVNVKLADGGGKIPQTAKAGTEIGVLTVGEGASQVKVPVALQGELASPGLGSKLTRVG